jgi:MerR family copper efflux transcriptional regulator
MKIGELATATGLAPSAIRFYEQSGLLPAAQRAANGYRSYSNEAVERLRFIQVAQALGFTLDTLRAIFITRGELSETELHDEMLQRLDTRLGEIDHMLATLHAQRKDLQALRKRVVASWADGECLDTASIQLSAVEPPPPACAPVRTRRVTRAPAPAPTPARRAPRCHPAFVSPPAAGMPPRGARPRAIELLAGSPRPEPTTDRVRSPPRGHPAPPSRRSGRPRLPTPRIPARRPPTRHRHDRRHRQDFPLRVRQHRLPLHAQPARHPVPDARRPAQARAGLGAAMGQ